MLFGCFFNSHFVFVSGKHISFLNACAFGFAVITNEFALLYICETGDRKQAMRNRLFDSWFAYANDKEQYVIMVANIQDLEGVDNYAAMILRKDNPHFVDYVSEFNNTVNMFMLKPEH